MTKIKPNFTKKLDQDTTVGKLVSPMRNTLNNSDKKE